MNLERLVAKFKMRLPLSNYELSILHINEKITDIEYIRKS